ncbi:MAG: tRNA lysidine(34) synthetase TilS [Gallionella sp.]|nr:tRNA lysidine(34) synthetase TilS [Gallionella sp.]
MLTHQMILSALHLPAHSRILVGLSGGVDSVVLLHQLHQLAPRFDWQLSALHVHHGISPNADAWADFCAEFCAALGVKLHIERVNIAPLRAEHGVEAAARTLRRAAFARYECDFVALAHHADDQAETVLLQLLRGAGVRGASAMPVGRVSTRQNHHEDVGLKPDLRFVRPLLTTSRADIVAYAHAHQLRWIEDESNQDDHYSRNFLRQHITPRLAEKFPAYRHTLARSAQHFAEASQLLDELAQLDAGETSATLAIARLQSLNPARSKNLLRYFLDQHGAPMPQTVQLDEMLHQLLTARQDAAVCVEYGDWQVRRYQGNIYALPALPEFNKDLVLQWQGEGELDWPPLNAHLIFKTVGTNLFVQLDENHANLSHLQLIVIALDNAESLTLRLRQGGETLRPHPQSPTRTVKNLLQEHGVPPWLRERLPLVYCGERLVAVIGG